jgi:hypothetical protein
LFAKEKGGILLSTTYAGSEPHEWSCGNPEHPSWKAEPWRVRKGAWCPSCAGNRPLGIDGLRAWGRLHGLELLDSAYRGTARLYTWRCAAGHDVRRNAKPTSARTVVRVRLGLGATDHDASVSAVYNFSGGARMSTLQRARSCTKSPQYWTNGGRSFASTMIGLATMLVNR